MAHLEKSCAPALQRTFWMPNPSGRSPGSLLVALAVGHTHLLEQDLEGPCSFHGGRQRPWQGQGDPRARLLQDQGGRCSTSREQAGPGFLTEGQRIRSLPRRCVGQRGCGRVLGLGT
ncbi:uncharacterized protein LOC142765331 isoform X4 [Rhipicephalus microplus]|uniref:uncharacterized protein LOC142765331 isoform X4 n=1 Tax=Rhipicephalus microplus TaxID=6941 RepID=UPI003F6BFA32